MASRSAPRPKFDRLIRHIARYVHDGRSGSARAMRAAHLAIVDSLSCAFEASALADCRRAIAPIVPNTIVPHGARVPATPWRLDPVEAAFATSSLIRWLDYNDAYYGETVIHPSDCIGALLAVADWQSRTRIATGKAPLVVHDVLDAMIRCYEVMGQLALANAFTLDMRIDHVVLIKIGVAAVVTRMLGGTREDIANALSQAFLDGQQLTVFRRGPDAGARKSWAAGDAAARGVWLALMTLRGEMGYPAALSAKTWGFNDVLNRGQPLKLAQPAARWSSSVIENLQFKISYPAGVHAQSAAEAAIKLHAAVRARLDKIKQVEIRTHRYAHGILNRNGTLDTIAARDHSMQYIVAIGLLFGRLEAADYEDVIAADPRIAALRAKTTLIEHAPYTQAFYDPQKRANPNAIRVEFEDGTATDWCEVQYPIGHPRRRKEGLPLLKQKFEFAAARVFAEKRRREIVQLCGDTHRLAQTPVDDLLDLIGST
ncbi:MAG: bifunctional 2-methylcitrate dehydratase/aconitate hydratase [Betaproteobacteria bacterium]|nr:bifunctional 2-methylcitrate dehydratase/aconitate hydratase [Betaproteobacteria bacterium]